VFRVSQEPQGLSLRLQPLHNIRNGGKEGRDIGFISSAYGEQSGVERHLLLPAEDDRDALGPEMAHQIIVEEEEAAVGVLVDHEDVRDGIVKLLPALQPFEDNSQGCDVCSVEAQDPILCRFLETVGLVFGQAAEIREAEMGVFLCGEPQWSPGGCTKTPLVNSMPVCG
jgi:hypothetical protein